MTKRKLRVLLCVVGLSAAGVLVWAACESGSGDPPSPSQEGFQKVLHELEKAHGDPLEEAARQLAPDPKAEIPIEDLAFYEQFLRTIPEAQRSQVIDLLKRHRAQK